MTVINITKEIIESQSLQEGFCVMLLDDGSISIRRDEMNTPRKNWSNIIKKDIQLQGDAIIYFEDILEEVKEWTW